MANCDDVCTRWLDRVMGRTTRANLSNSRLFGDDDKLYSYGAHFPLIEVLRDKGGRPRGMLLNGDRWGPTTAKHQGHARTVAARSCLPHVTIPFDALNSAGIDHASIEIVDNQPERWEQIPHEETATSWPWAQEGYRWEWRPELAYRELTDEERAEYAGSGWSPTRGVMPTGEWRVYREPPRKGRPWNVKIDVPDDAAVLMFCHMAGCDVRGITTQPVTFSWTTTRHWLGESLIRAKVRTDKWRDDKNGISRRVHRWAYFLSGFDDHESRPLYFLAELPRVSVAPTTVAEAYRDLMPETVKLAVAMGKNIKRQGDIFAVPMSLTTRQLRSMGAEFGRMNHRARKVDKATVVDAGAVIFVGDEVMTIDADHGATTERLLGTNHVATYVARVGDMTLARGCLYHRPDWRDPDHGRVKLGPEWHVILKNTVPVVK